MVMASFKISALKRSRTELILIIYQAIYWKHVRTSGHGRMRRPCSAHPFASGQIELHARCRWSTAVKMPTTIAAPIAGCAAQNGLLCTSSVIRFTELVCISTIAVSSQASFGWAYILHTQMSDVRFAGHFNILVVYNFLLLSHRKLHGMHDGR